MTRSTFLLPVFLAFAFGFAPVAVAKVGSNTILKPYIIPAGGTNGTITTPPSSGGTGGGASSGVLTTIGGSLESAEPPVPVTDAAGNVWPVQGQSAWFAWTPVQSISAVITVTSANPDPYQFQPVVAIYSLPSGGSLSFSSSTPTPTATNYIVSPNPVAGTQAAAAGGAQTSLAVPGIFQTVVFINATAGTTYFIQVDGVVPTGFPFVGQGNFTLSLLPTTNVYTSPAPTFYPQSGWWWDSAIPGIGFGIEINGRLSLSSPGSFYMGTFLFDSTTTATSTWYVAQGEILPTPTSIAAQAGRGAFPAVPAIPANSYYSMPMTASLPLYLQQYTNGSTLSAAATGTASLQSYQSPISLIFTSSTVGKLIVNGTSFPIQRYAIPGASPVLPSTSTASTSATKTTSSPLFQNGWYYTTTEGGSGVFIEQQSNQVFMAAFLYRALAQAGTPIWYLSNGSLSTTSLYAGRLYEYAGGAGLVTMARNPAPVITSITDRGALSLQLTGTTGNLGTLNLPNRSMSLVKYTF